MTIQVRFFASLRERLGRAEHHLPADGIGTVADVWVRASGDAAPPAQLLCAINQVYATFDAPVVDGDEVAFFPPVTGG